MILTITGREQAFAKNGSEYLKLTGVDGTGKETTKSVFDHFKAQWESLQPDTTWEFKMEKKGQFWNIVEIRPIAEAVKEKIPAAETPNLVKEATKIATMSKDDWAEKDRITRKSIERQTALKEAVNLATLHPELATGDKVIATAKKFERYIETGE